ncbi:MAG: BrnT family toxin [Alphaproteobacteria bacterium]|nr:BrnT family toxin [Alphaproteobacteria bacterium]
MMTWDETKRAGNIAKHGGDFTRRNGDIHVISLRKANRRECNRYEAGT